MHDDAAERSATTRRNYVTGAGATVLAGSFAGCTSGTRAETEAGTDPTGSETNPTTTTDDGPYSVRMSPMGEVAFDSVPENVFTVFPQYADMAVALGHGETLNSVYVPEMSGTTMNHYYHHLDGVAFEWEELVDPLSDGLSRELLFELDSDVHLSDPAWVSTRTNWGRSEVAAVESEVAPWFGNFYSGTRAPAPKGYGDYRYYDLWELFGRVAAVFRERERYEALAAVHADLVSTIRADLPPEDERPTAVRVTLAGDGETFYTYHLNEPGYWLADTRPLGANDAFASADWGSLWGTVDYETMLEADPGVVLHLWGLSPNRDMADVRSTLESHPVGSQLQVVADGRVHAAGMRYQGPIMNLFQLEMGAKQLYPDRFGEWPRYRDGDHYPDIPEGEWLFDRNRVASIVSGRGSS